MLAAMPISGCYAQYVCLPQRKFIPVPAGLDPAEAVAVVLNYITAYQMLHRSAKVEQGQRVLIHGASGASALHSYNWAGLLASKCTELVPRRRQRQSRALKHALVR